MREIKALVASCPDCPFHEYIEAKITSDFGVFEAGHYCLHKEVRQYVITVAEIAKGRGARGELSARYGQPFPPFCPLDRVQYAAPGTGRRVLDLQPVATEQDT